MQKKWVEILIFTGEGGSLGLYGYQKENKWLFSKRRDESVLIDLLDDEDKDLSSFTYSQSEIVASWDEAIQLIGNNWKYLNLSYVHPAFLHKMRELISKEENVPHRKRWEAKLSRYTAKNTTIWKEREDDIALLARLIAQSRSTVVFTGAGMSTESGLQDFRSANRGMWNNRNPIELADISALEDNHEEFVRFYQ